MVIECHLLLSKCYIEGVFFMIRLQ